MIPGEVQPNFVVAMRNTLTPLGMGYRVSGCFPGK